MKKQYNRRNFIKTAAGLGLMGMMAPLAMSFISNGSAKKTKLIILSTNDVHSRIDPFPANDKHYAGMAGFAQRATLINEIRAENEHVLLLDAGDIFQGTPYFNMYGGALEFELMSKMGYDAATMGNHDFDNGMEGFKKHLHQAEFPFICSNYDFSQTILKDATIPYKIIEKGPLKIGIIGIGIELQGLVSDKNYGKTIYLDPVETANKYAAKLKSEGCHYIVCISHLGFEYEDDKISDKKLASQSRNIDYIIGGHTHTFMDSAAEVLDLNNKTVSISQAGWGGILLGQMDIEFDNEIPANSGVVYTTKKVRSQV
jgi:5'-nucleotidase